MRLQRTILVTILIAVQAFPAAGQIPTSLVESLRIGEEGKFIRIDEVLTDHGGSIIVTDAYRFSVKQFSAQGACVREFGTRGSGDTAFLAVPYKLVATGNSVGIIEKGSSRIRFFDARFFPVRTTEVPGIIIDAVCDATGAMYVNLFPFSAMTDELLVKIAPGGTGSVKLPLSDVRSEPVLNMVHLAVTSKNELVVAHRFLNSVVMYDAAGKIRRVISIAGWSAQSPAAPAGSVPSSIRGYKELPAGDLIGDIAVDRRTDCLFVLGGEYSPDPYRVVEVYDNDGNHLTTLRLPEKSGILYADDAGNLFTRERERTVLKKYRIVYTNVHK